MADEEDDLSELRERLLSHSTCFNSLLELIPAKYYFSENEEEKSNKFYKNKKNKAPKQAVKEASKKAKLSRLDPSQHKTVPEIQAELSIEDGKAVKGGRLVSVEDVACSSIGDLRTKLHERIELMKRKRKAPSTFNSDSDRPTKKARNLAKKKESKKQKKNPVNSSQINSKHIVNNKKAIVNNEGKVVFSKFDFSSDVAKSQRKGHAKVNYQKLLEKAEGRRRKLEEMKEDKTEKSKEIIEATKWKKALGKSEGVKQKDDPALLKKAIKRKEKQKKKHQKDWKERMENQKKQMKERQDRRQKNIQDRIDKKKKKKGGRTPGF